MSVVMESSRPLEELIDAKYAKRRGVRPAKRMLDSLLWASENLLLCVVREKGEGGTETVKVRPELAATARRRWRRHDVFELGPGCRRGSWRRRLRG